MAEKCQLAWRGDGRGANRGNMKTVSLSEREAAQSGESSEWDNENTVLHVNGVGVKPLVLTGKIN